MVDGKTITEEEASAPGWIATIRRRAKSSTTASAAATSGIDKTSSLPHLRKSVKHCGIEPTRPDHECVTRKCAFCGQAQITGGRTCPNRYRFPYVVRRRRCHRRRRNNNQQTQGDSATQQPTPKQPASTPPMKHLPTTSKNQTATPSYLGRPSRGTGKTDTQITDELATHYICTEPSSPPDYPPAPDDAEENRSNPPSLAPRFLLSSPYSSAARPLTRTE
ncbi:hypothetical protein HPB51_006560 [Rhipicephalus microplus]|uniref:Uncharacterized protein n=1 Tax=Rhipicephalus microplus TaxID=6941 RepID=A0A9J6E7M5_RHIMP|nr:hypothetical protein HPB51_006560 [Rhipicephalus microplus]